MGDLRRHRVIVIGAGAAGLQCARCLVTDHGLDADSVLVLEARPQIGGRIQQSHDFAPGHKVELGAEFVHGETTRLNAFAERFGWELQPLFTWAQGDGGPSSEPAPDGGHALYYLGNEKQLLRWDSDDPDFNALNE